MSAQTDILLEELRKLKSQSDAGFEGFVRDLLEFISRRRLRLLKSGPQGGMDIIADADLSLPGIAFEAKRFAAATNLPLDELKSKLRDAVTNTPGMDLWGIVASKEIKQPDFGELEAVGAEYGVTLICLDWRETAGSVPALAAICAVGRHITEAKFGNIVIPALDEIVSHPDFRNVESRIRTQISAPEIGLDLTSEAVGLWFEEVLVNRRKAREFLRHDAAIASSGAHYVVRGNVRTALDEWAGNKENTPAVLLGDEGRGKSWAALGWCRERTKDPAAPMTLVMSAKDVQGTEAVEIIANALHRIIPLVESSQWARRLRRWASASHDSPPVILVIDGLNEAWGKDWPEIVRLFDAEPWNRFVTLLLTCRPSFWKDDLLRLQGVTEQPIVEIKVSDFGDSELDAYLDQWGLKRGDFSHGLLQLIRVPRFAALCIRLRNQVQDTEDLTVARLVLEDWRARVQVNSELKLDNVALQKFIADVGKGALANIDQLISQNELHQRLSQDSGYDLNHYRATISELASGLWFQPTEHAHKFRVNDKLLPFAIGLDLARVISPHEDQKAVADIIAQYLEQLGGADIGVSILRAASSLMLAQGQGTTIARRTLIDAWLDSRNFSGLDFEEFWRLIGRDPELFLRIAEARWSTGPLPHQETEILAKALANSCKWPAVTELLARTFPLWVGAYGNDPQHWLHKTIPVHQDRSERTAKNLDDLRSAPAHIANLIKNFREDARDHLCGGALAVISFTERLPFIDTLLTWALTRAAMGMTIREEAFNWVLRLNSLDNEECQTALVAIIGEWRASGIAARCDVGDDIHHPLGLTRTNLYGYAVVAFARPLKYVEGGQFAVP